MRRRVVCPRSHPASPYLRRPLADFAMARGAFPGGYPPDPPCRPMARWVDGACHLRPLGGVRAPAVLRRGWGGPGLLLPGVTACAEAGGRGGWSRGVPRGRPGMAGRRARSLGEPPFLGEYCPLRWVIQNPPCTTRRGHFRPSKHDAFGLAEPARITSAVFTFS